MKKIDKNKSNTKKNTFIAIGVLMILIIATTIGASIAHKRAQTSLQRKNFAFTNIITRNITEEIATKYGLTNTQRLSRCFQSGQGPFDDGELYCSNGYIGTLDESLKQKPDTLIDIQQIVNKRLGVDDNGFGFGKVVDFKPSIHQGKNGDSSSVNNYYYAGDKNQILCTLQIEEQYGSAYIPSAYEGKFGFYLNCQQRANEKFFQYVPLRN